jgi:hypothetical protein
MKYRDVIDFAPIETVVQLIQADAIEDSRSLVRSLVVSDRMADDLKVNVADQLSLVNAQAKGIFVVGNYGTGKSHVMAVVAGLAEHRELLDDLASEPVKGAFTTIAGEFVVVRAEINGLLSLRDFVMGALKSHLASLGVVFEVPPEHEVGNHKDVFVTMLDAFEATFPGKGLLFVLDELLDYLRANDNQQLIANLNFLRAVGETCSGSRFRFIAGIQESLFANPSFQFATESIQRVQARFVQMRIVREDISYVVARRLLRKSPQQEGLVRHHLEKFAPLYDLMAERMDEFVRLFPVHPRYLEVFERIHVAEKREAFKTLSGAIQRILESDVPDDATGLIGYDSYWPELSGNAIFAANPEIREVLEKSRVLEDKVRTSLPKAAQKPAAIRIIHALSVQRLAQAGIKTSLGVTATELRDGLCLVTPMPPGSATADFLKVSIETILRAVINTVNGQFIAFNPDNQQYYLDLTRDVDFELLVEQRGQTLSPGVLDRYYFDILRRTIFQDPSVESNPYVRDPQVWEYEVPWRARGVTRTGYLFFGTPNQRSTANPPRDCYLYFVQPFAPPKFTDERKRDEAFFRLTGIDDGFTRVLRLYAGAQEMALHSAAASRPQYSSIAARHLQSLAHWLAERHAIAFEVTCEASRVPSAAAPNRPEVRDWVADVAARAFGPHFEAIAPSYPTFRALITRSNRAQAATDAIRWFAGGIQNRLGVQVLEALKLVDGDALTILASPYAQAILAKLSARDAAHVLNRAELVAQVGGVDYWSEFRLEPEFLAVVVAAMAYTGHLVLNAGNGVNLDATSGAQFTSVGLDNLVGFRHLRRPRDFPVAALNTLFQVLGLAPVALATADGRDAAILQLQEAVAARLRDVATASANMASLTLWGESIVPAEVMSSLSGRLAAGKQFMQSVQAFKTAAQMTNFPHDAVAIEAQRPNLEAIREVLGLRAFVQQHQATTQYIQNAELVLGSTHPWTAKATAKRAELIKRVVTDRSSPGFAADFARELAALRDEYRGIYMEAHRRARLGVDADKRKARLNQDPRLAQLGRLKAIALMPVAQLEDLQRRMLALNTCFSLTTAQLESRAWCPHCNFRLAEEPAQKLSAEDALNGLDERLDALVTEWTATLLRNLETPDAKAGLDLLAIGEGRAAVTNFINRRELPDPMAPQMVTAIQTLLQGLERVEITPAAIEAALGKGGLPCTVAELKSRFDQLLTEATRGKPPARVRIVLGTPGNA